MSSYVDKQYSDCRTEAQCSNVNMYRYVVRECGCYIFLIQKKRTVRLQSCSMFLSSYILLVLSLHYTL